MYSTPQETTALKNMLYAKVKHALDMGKVGGALELLSDPYAHESYKIYAIFKRSAATDLIPPFTQPMLLSTGEIAIDLRPYWSQIGHFIELGKSLPGGPANTTIELAILMRMWLEGTEYRNRLLTLGDIPIHTYSYWLGEGVSRVISADTLTQRSIVQLSAWFYHCLFLESNSSINEDYVYKVAGKIARLTWGQVEEVVDLINTAGFLENLHEFSRAVRELPSLRTDKVNPGLIVTALSGSWFGSSNAKESVIVGIEYPPMFLAIVHSACTDNFYRKSPLLDIAKRIDKQGRFAEFNRAYQNVLHK